MRRVPFLAVIAQLLTVAGACRSARVEEVRMLAGTWIPVEAELGGQPFPEAILRVMKLTLGEGRYVVNVGEQVDKGTFEVGTGTQPHAMDITGTEGPNRGKTILAIYELSGDNLRICYELAGTERPGEFETKLGSQRFLIRYRRENS